jgi:hypothetical protein
MGTLQSNPRCPGAPLCAALPEGQASRLPAAAPPPLCCPAAFLDVTQKGAVLDAAAARLRYPQLGAAFGTCGVEAGRGSGEGNGSGSSSSSGGGGTFGGDACIVGVWSEMARTMVTAHQRRGESDLVAHWMYQALALDSRAPEWAHTLGAART